MKFLFVALLCLGGCATAKTDAKADWTAAADCAKVDPQNVALILAAESCIVSVASGKEQDCLADLAAVATWSADELACVISKTVQK